MRFNRPYVSSASGIIKLMGVLGLAGALTYCVEPFDLPVEKEEVSFLVIDGFLNTGNGEVNLNLTRATLINEAEAPFEADALVSLEDPEGNRHALSELGSGKYKGIAPSLEAGKQYRLFIKTRNGKEYRSAFVTIRPTPAIDSLGWRANADGTQIVIDTHDATNKTRYYRWTFEETWEYRSWYKSYWRFADVESDTVIFDEYLPRLPEEMVHICFKTERSTQIYTTSTANLTEDIVNDYEIRFLPVGTEKLSQNYSIIVRQYAISKETYDYLEKLKKTSQDLGGLYAPQPSKVTGNIHNAADPSEVVLGYFDAGQIIEKRIYIAHKDLPDHLRVYNEWMLCYKDTLRLQRISEETHIVLDQIPDETGMPAGFIYTTIECADCRVKGGVTAKPDYMPNPNRW